MQISTKNRNKTEHLSKEEINNLKIEYYAGENTRNLVDKYKIDVSNNSLYTSFPLVLKLGLNCKYCNFNMYFVPPPKNAKHRKQYFCTTCKHTEGINNCDCKQCMKQNYDDRQQNEVKRFLQIKKDNILKVREYTNSHPFDRLTIKEKAYLGALLRVSLNKKYLLICISNGAFTNMAPTLGYRELIIAELLEKNIITPYLPSKHIDDKIAKDFFSKIYYDMCVIDINRNKKELIEYLMYPDKVSFSKHSESITVLKEIHFYEAIEYMNLTLQQFNLHIFESEARYRILFLKILEEYSLSQLFNFIYSTIKNHTKYIKSSNHRHIPISNHIYKQLSSKYEHAQTKNWDITSFRRPWQAGQTELSKILCNRLLDKGESCFYRVVIL